MKKLLALSLYCCLYLISYSQSYDPSKVDAKAAALLEEAVGKVEFYNAKEAIPLLQKAIAIDARFVDAWLLLARIYRDTQRYDDCISSYEKAFAIDSVYSFEYLLPYAIAWAGKGEFEKALSYVKKLLAADKLNPNTRRSAEYRQKSFQFAVDYPKQHPSNGYVFAPKNMGDSINSPEPEYFPSLTIDGSEFIFTRNVGRRNEDFFVSRKSGAAWSAAKAISGDVNTPGNEGAQMISQDGQWLVFTGCDRRDGYGSCDLYLSYLTDKGWSEAINLGGIVNSEFWDSQPSLSPDKKDLYFSSRLSGGYGGSDIYVSHLQPNGKWTVPENLGKEINSPGDEQCPFIHADNQTLYFTSNGLLGYGQADLFYVRKEPGNVWGKPVNLGYPINTIDQEGTLFIGADGKTAYYASDRPDGKGGLDIYTFELREDVRPYKTLWVKGQVFDAKTKKGLPSAVELIDLATRQPLSKVQTDEKGNYLLTLPLGKDYAFNVNRRGYLFYSDNFPLKQRSPDSTYVKNIPLQPLEINATVILNNVFFDVNKFELKPESQVELEKIVQLLNENPTLKIEISGHTDNAGKPADNLALSNNRSKAVVTYLVGKGIAAARLISKGYGETKPVADNKTEEGRARNRRTEMRVTAQ
jgi:outer membrane protein OmpA-like peptidoglycan-associated protein/tetratricopeptide (TPR) repeat protein